MKLISYLVRTFIALVLIGTLATCVPEYDDPSIGFGDGQLSVSATVSDAVVVTKAQSVEALNEKQLNTLDVFVEHVTNGVGDGTFLKQYHLVTNDNAGNPISEAKNFLAARWRQEGLQSGQYYNIYVAVNNTKTKVEIASVAALKALTYSEVEEGIAVVDATSNNISWPTTDQFAKTPSGFIYKQYVPESGADAVKVNGNLYGFTTEKEFMMDAVLKNWTPVSGSKDQVFGGDSNGNVTLNRAAAKFVLNVKFDADFLKSLTHKKDGDNWVEKPATEQVTITGAPAWRFYNFAFGAPVFAPDPETQGAGVEVHSSETLLLHPYPYEGEDKHFQIITYSYPNAWDANDYSTAAPSLVISVGYTENNVTNYHYYRIPLVKSTVTKIERNHIYVINATIATRGSATQEDVTLTEDIQYAVLHWNDKNNSEAVQNNVESVQQYYLRVNPKVYTLRGDGNQSVTLNYSKASGTKVNWKLFTYDAEGNQTGVVANDATGAVRAWFYNADGNFTTTYNDNSGTNWNNMGVNIVQSQEGVAGSKGTVTVTSTALNNKAIKYIRLRVYLDETVIDEETGEEHSLEDIFHEDIIIRHFPTDNIQNISGSWSSYHDIDAGTQAVTLTTTSLSEAQSWAEQYGVMYTSSEVPVTEYISYAEYSAHVGETGYTMNGPTSSNYNTFHSMVQNETNRQNANSQANAVADGGEGNSYYWGTGATMVAEDSRNYYGQYDYRVFSHQGMMYTYYNYYKYTNYFTATYTHTYTYTQYSVTVQMATTGNWVDWDRDAYETYSGSNRKINGNSNFYAKVYDNGIIKAVVVNQNGNDKTYSLKYGDNYEYYYYWNGSTTSYKNTRFNATNNHMYVIQISSTSDEYILGRPVKGNPSENQSYDDVVSPAFMIASQLGAVSAFGGDNAATEAANHCERYMEVAEDGTRYTGWRLPTKSEISVIADYQNGNIGGVTIPSQYRVLTVVLGGDYYWSLSGERVSTVEESTETITYLRCVRDLSAEEVDRQNGFDKIQEKYR